MDFHQHYTGYAVFGNKMQIMNGVTRHSLQSKDNTRENGLQDTRAVFDQIIIPLIRHNALKNDTQTEVECHMSSKLHLQWAYLMSHQARVNKRVTSCGHLQLNTDIGKSGE